MTPISPISVMPTSLIIKNILIRSAWNKNVRFIEITGFFFITSLVLSRKRLDNGILTHIVDFCKSAFVFFFVIPWYPILYNSNFENWMLGCLRKL